MCSHTHTQRLAVNTFAQTLAPTRKSHQRTETTSCRTTRRCSHLFHVHACQFEFLRTQTHKHTRHSHRNYTLHCTPHTALGWHSYSERGGVGGDAAGEWLKTAKHFNVLAIVVGRIPRARGVARTHTHTLVIHLSTCVCAGSATQHAYQPHRQFRPVLSAHRDCTPATTHRKHHV